jgi:hypothetical protein
MVEGNISILLHMSLEMLYDVPTELLINVDFLKGLILDMANSFICLHKKCNFSSLGFYLSQKIDNNNTLLKK